MRFRSLFLALAGLTVALGTAEAQRRRGIVDVTPDGSRHGFWLSGGVGYGEESNRFDGESDYTDGLAKPVVSLRLGGTPDPHLRLGGEVAVWWNTFFDDAIQDNITESLASFMLIGQFYPVLRSGLFIKGGAGIGRSAAEPEFGQGVSETGFAVVVGAGYDIPLSRNVSLTPTVDFYKHRFTKANEPTLHERLVQFGVAITVQPGR